MPAGHKRWTFSHSNLPIFFIYLVIYMKCLAIFGMADLVESLCFPGAKHRAVSYMLDGTAYFPGAYYQCHLVTEL